MNNAERTTDHGPRTRTTDHELPQGFVDFARGGAGDVLEGAAEMTLVGKPGSLRHFRQGGATALRHQPRCELDAELMHVGRDRGSHPRFEYARQMDRMDI